MNFLYETQQVRIDVSAIVSPFGLRFTRSPFLPCMSRRALSGRKTSFGRRFGSSNHILLKLNSVALVRERTITTERPPPVGEVSANFCGQRGVTWSAQRIPTAVLISVESHTVSVIFFLLIDLFIHFILDIERCAVPS